jgi:membrane-associated phospholipid phosphatase
VSQPGTTPPGAISSIPTAPSLDSDTYARDFQEVKLIGERTSPARTADESEIALFWANGPATETPPGHWQEIVTTIAAQKGLSLLDTSRLYAGVGLALADAGIAGWSVKYSPALWRPITAIQQADRDGNPLTSADPGWASFVATPMFPTFPSGHSTFSAAAATVASALVGPVQPFSVMGGDARTIQREYSSLWQAAEESGRSRILGGIHFNFDNLTGLAMGQAIGSLVVDQALMAQVWLGDGGITYRYDPLNSLYQARAVQGGTGDDLIMGASQQGNRLFGGLGRDQLQGGSRADVLDGGEGFDHLQGFGGSDLLNAGADGARLEGSFGAESGEVDQLICGSGVDRMVLSNSNEKGLNYSFDDSYAVIRGFDPLVDSFELARNDFSANTYRFASLLPAGASFAGQGPASTWLYRNDDIIACFEGVDLARWGGAAATGPLSQNTCPSMALVV